MPATETYTEFQKLVHLIPETTNRFLGGGRGGGKSQFIAQLVTKRARRYRELAQILVLRQGPYKSLNDLIATFQAFFTRLWGADAHHLNRSDHTWRLPTGTYLEIGILPDGRVGRQYYEKVYQGRNFTDLFADEVQQFAQPDNLDLVISNLRGPIPTQITFGANPGGIGHQWIASRYANRDPWKHFIIERTVEIDTEKVHTKRVWVSCPSTYQDNPHLGKDYKDNLMTACGHDEELLKAWLTGNWNISRGAYFAAVLDNPKIEISWPDPAGWGDWEPSGWNFWLSYDHGTAKPAACYVMARSPGSGGPDGRYYPAESILILDEWACYRPLNLAAGFGWTIPDLCGPIRALAARWRIPASGVADDACFSFHGHEGGSISDEYANEGVVWRPAGKGQRAARFLQMKRMLAAAGQLEKPARLEFPGQMQTSGQMETPGLYVSKRCEYWWNTVPFLVHDPRDPEVVLKCDTDHGLDASSYGLRGGVAQGGVMTNVN